MMEEDASISNTSILARNEMRAQITAAFTSVTCWPTYDNQLQQSHGTEEQLTTCLTLKDFSNDYQKFFEDFTTKVAGQCDTLHNREGIPDITDAAYYATMMKSIVNALNVDNEAKFPVSFFDQVQKDRLNELCDELMDDQLGKERYVHAMKMKWNETGMIGTLEDAITELQTRVTQVKTTIREKKYKETIVSGCTKMITSSRRKHRVSCVVNL